MIRLNKKLVLIFFFTGFFSSIRAANLDEIGVPLLRATTTNLNGANIRIAQPEANYDRGTNWEVNPGAVSQPTSLFTYLSANGSTNNFPNSLSSDSGHADSVAKNFYGLSTGVATNVAHVDNYDAEFFYNSVISAAIPPAINVRVVNQSYIFGYVTNSSSPVPPYISVSDQQSLDSQFDDYAAKYGVLFVSGIGNGDHGGKINPPATCYNGIGVGAFGGGSSTGPTLDNGRCKPDLVAPATETSFSTPYVAGAAAVLMQAALRGDGGGDTNSAADIRTIKALLLNGAVKPANWTNSNSSPLDARYGAGVLNIFNSYEQLVGGEHHFISSEMIASGGAHLPGNSTGTISNLNGWDFNSISSQAAFLLNPAQDGVNHYYFNVTNGSPGAKFTAAITLVWNRQQNQSDINNLNLFLYDCANSNLVMCSTSLVDNVEYIFLPQLAQGRYDLQVLKSAENSVGDNEAYALAWEFFSKNLSAEKSRTNLILRWPVYPGGFAVESATNLISPNWSTNNLPLPIFTNKQNVILLNATNAAQFFRLRTPNF